MFYYIFVVKGLFREYLIICSTETRVGHVSVAD